MAQITIHTDGAGNKYVGYSGDPNTVAIPQDVVDTLVPMIEDFIDNTAIILSAEDSDLSNTNNRAGISLLWRYDTTSISGTNITNLGDGDEPSFGNSHFATLLGMAEFGDSDKFVYVPTSVNTEQVSGNQVHVKSETFINDDRNKRVFLSRHDKAVAYSNGRDVGIFGWSVANDGTTSSHDFVWCGEVLGNSNITDEQARSSIATVDATADNNISRIIDSYGVQQPDNDIRRNHHADNATANHTIDCSTNTAKLYLIESDSGNDNTVGYCDNLFLTKANVSIGGFVTIRNIGDSGSEDGIVVAPWGSDGYIVMRQYDGTS